MRRGYQIWSKCQKWHTRSIFYKKPIYKKVRLRKSEKQAGAGAVPSSGLVNSLVKIEVFFCFVF